MLVLAEAIGGVILVVLIGLGIKWISQNVNIKKD